MRKWRVTTWLLIVWNVLMVAWLVSAASATTADCSSEPTRDLRRACELGTDAGTGIAVVFILVVWFLGFVMLSLLWMMRRHARRDRNPRPGAITQN
jgi:hypothetical protein